MKRYRSINFDLNTKKLKEHYPNKNYTEAYNDIKKFLLKNGFEHRQGSGYISQKELSNYEVSSILKELSKQYTWLKDCYKAIDCFNLDEKIGLDFANVISRKADQKPNPKDIQKEIKQTYKISNYQPKNKNKTNNKDIER